jgi:hypothetical protein
MKATPPPSKLRTRALEPGKGDWSGAWL